MSYGDLEALAVAVRHKLGIPMTAMLPAMALFERLDELELKVGDRVIPLTYAVEEQEVEGRTYYDEKLGRIVVTLSEETYNGLEAGNPRAFFTFGHEVGHPFCHPRLLMKLPYISHEKIALMREISTHPKYKDVEWQANGFSAALLAPADGLLALEGEGRLRVSTIESVFNMSRQSAEYRLDNFRRFRQRMLNGAKYGRRSV
jgi:Zn-dependent peptidase ImmA (M78 family)